MPLRIGITGGIGSGKTTVARIFEVLGIPVYYADDAAKKIMNALSIEADWLWTIIYILLVTIIWPMMVLIISLPFGQFRFFYNYTRKLGQKMGFVKAGKTNDQN